MALNFGTSGVRGLAVEFTPESVFGYIKAFYAICMEPNQFERVAVGCDLRASSPDIFELVCESFGHLKVQVLDCGEVPTPALAHYCRQQNVPGVMITGSHIPADRNGLKFYLQNVEILKSHEHAIQQRFFAETIAAPQRSQIMVTDVASSCASAFVMRYLSYFSKFKDLYLGKTVIVFEHSSVARDLLGAILKELGFTAIGVRRSHEFVPVDTEAMSTEGDEIGKWLMAHKGAIGVVSTDGDGDRPFIASEIGDQVRGDLIGLISARFLGIQSVVTPISSSTSIEKSGAFSQVVRTKIGSPFVVEQLLMDGHKGHSSGFEANGGFILGTVGLGLDPLLTRDSILPILCVLTACLQEGKSISTFVQELPGRCNEAVLVKGVDPDVSKKVLASLASGEAAEFLAQWGEINIVDKIDGLRFEYKNDRVVHFRPSGNAPEFRVYSEAESLIIAKEIVNQASTWLKAQNQVLGG